MTRLLVVLVATVVAVGGLAVSVRGQTRSDTSLAGSWLLRAVERRAIAGGRIANPRGLLVFDTAGHVCEIVTTADRPSYAGAQATAEQALAAFDSYTGFWGSYRIESGGRLLYRPEAAVNPNLVGQEVVRTYETAGDELSVTAGGSEPLETGTRWVWMRVPPVDGITAAHRRISGFWRWVSETSLATATGAVVSEVARGPSVIAYTPSGFVCVHFPRAGRTRFAGDRPTGDEARQALAGYTSYIAALTVHSGFIFHHQMSALAPSPGTSLQRFFEFQKNDMEVRYLFPPTIVAGQERRTQVILRRLSSAAEMMP